ncbi:MAG: branched-chain amino acid ABC transporter permease [Rhizobiaceae bacterium]|nr:branched-chain amino acid ABC transporter permease [Rhizobiaceae bacterium]
MILQQILSGILASGVYALFAVGFTMIFGIMGVLNMAHADLAMVAALVVIGAVSAGFGPFAGIAIAVIVTLIIALLIERVAMRPGRRFKGDAAIEMPLIGTLGAGLILQNTAALIFGNKALSFPIKATGIWRLGSFFFTQGLVYSMLVSLILLAALEYVVNQTNFGRMMRAVAINPTAARIMGIDTDRIIVATIGITSFLAAVAGFLAGFSYGLATPLMGIPYAIKGLVAMIVGGVGSLRGAVAGAVLIGIVEAIATTYFGSQARDPSVLLVLIITLIIWPNGLSSAFRSK